MVAFLLVFHKPVHKHVCFLALDHCNLAFVFFHKQIELSLFFVENLLIVPDDHFEFGNLALQKVDLLMQFLDLSVLGLYYLVEQVLGDVLLSQATGKLQQCVLIVL